MKTFEIIFNNGAGKEIQAKNLREAKKIAILEKDMIGIYEGYTARAGFNRKTQTWN